MTTPREVWSYGNDSVEEGRQVFNMLRNATSDAADIQSRIRRNDWADWLANRVLSFNNGTSGVSHAAHIRRGDFRFRGLDYVNENPSTKDAQLARAHQYSRDARSEAREVKGMVKALASTLDDLLEGQGKILRAVEDAETQVVQANAEDVAAELEVTVRDEAAQDQEEDES